MGLQILAMAAMFAPNFVSRERYVIPSCACENEELLFVGAEISQKEVWRNSQTFATRLSCQPNILSQKQPNLIKVYHIIF